jgi:hypothetical protein
MGILVELVDVDAHLGSKFAHEGTRKRITEHSASSDVSDRGVKKTCRPGEIRDVNGGVDL